MRKEAGEGARLGGGGILFLPVSSLAAMGKVETEEIQEVGQNVGMERWDKRRLGRRENGGREVGTMWGGSDFIK